MGEIAREERGRTSCSRYGTRAESSARLTRSCRPRIAGFERIEVTKTSMHVDDDEDADGRNWLDAMAGSQLWRVELFESAAAVLSSSQSGA